MKTNLDLLFKTDADAERQGTWIEIAPGAEFKIKRFGGHNSASAMKIRSTLSKPYARQLQQGILDVEVENELGLKVFIKCCLSDWKGICDQHDNDVEFTEKNALDLLKRLPDLYEILSVEATKIENFREDVGNS